ncbi:MAG: response regulator [Gemmatimonadales bacterium]|nr:MAG: response regulator [Gemmatimonadales bacterium]
MVSTGTVDILLVEDDPRDVELTLRALRAQDLDGRTVVVNDGAQALEYLSLRGGSSTREPPALRDPRAPQDPRALRDPLPRPRVILLDLKLPKLSGLEVLRRLKTDPQTRLIPVVVLTSSREERDVTASYELGANSYLVKPVAFEELLRSVADIQEYWLVRNEPPPPPRIGGPPSR